MFASLPRQAHVPRQLSAALLIAATVSLLGLLAPSRGLASVGAWTPSSAGLMTAARTCPSPAIAEYYDATCWTAQLDQSSPLYWSQAPYPWAQCTYWALEMRPDLWNNQSSSDPNSDDWTAYTWPQHAALEGLTVDHAPAAGAIIVWPQSDSNSTGHVAYVQSVGVDPITGDDLVTLQEMNDTTFDDPSQGQGDTMTMSMDSGDLAGVQFIHPPTGNAPASSPTTTTTKTTATTTPSRTTTTSKTTTNPASPGPTTTIKTTTITPTRNAPTRTTKHPAVTAGKRSRPRLSLRITVHGLKISTLSPAPLQATVHRLPSGKVFAHARLHSGTGLKLPAGRYRVCVSQPTSGDWRSARVCVDGTASSSAHTPTARIRPQAISRPTSATLLSGLR
jgi:surface antigen